MNELILNWQRRVDLDENLYYKKAAERQAIFVRDTICGKLLKTPCFVVSQHMSKSCLLPVYFFKLNNGIEVICRDNFYGWVVSIKTPSSTNIINLPTDLVHGDGVGHTEDIHAVYCEGFKDEWVYPYKDNHAMTVRVDSDFHFWALMRELNTYKWDTNKIEEVVIPKTKEYILEAFCDSKHINQELDFSDIFHKTWCLDSKEYYKGCFDLWQNEEKLAERINNDALLFDTFVKEWSEIKWGMRFK